MTRLTLSSAAFALALLPAFASAQSALPDPSKPGSGYQVPAITQAPVIEHADCGDQVAQLENDVALRVSRPSNGNDSLTQLHAHLQNAANAAAAGDNASCAYWLKRFKDAR